ncbi:MAG: hypothetical protein WDW38_009968 [Sanguina aurantia]
MLSPSTRQPGVQLLLQTPICCLLTLVACAVLQQLLAAAAADEQHTSHGDLWRMVAVLRRLCPDLLCTVCRSARPCQCSATDTLDHRNAAARACCTGAPCDTWVGGLVISERAPLRQLQLLAAAA